MTSLGANEWNHGKGDRIDWAQSTECHWRANTAPIVIIGAARKATGEGGNPDRQGAGPTGQIKEQEGTYGSRSELAQRRQEKQDALCQKKWRGD